jgi:tetratricopeptide (TPR) repeat protein
MEQNRGDLQKAQEMYEKALRVQPDFPPAANNLAFLMMERGGNTDVALSLAQTARRGMPDSPNAADTLAWAYYQKGTYSLAIDLLEEAVKKVPQNVTYQYHLGLAYSKANDKGRARVHLERALALKPSPAVAEQVRKALGELGT